MSAAASEPYPVGPHRWVGAAEVMLDPREVAGVARRLAVTRDGPVHIDVVEVFCARCRRSFPDARHSPCEPEAPVLRGGPSGRKRRGSQDALSDEEAVASLA